MWLNAIFTDDDETLLSTDKETIATNLVFKLQLMVEETNNSLEEIAQRMILSVPKVIGEADVLNSETIELCNQMTDVRTKLICVEQQNNDVVDTLVQLDKAKYRLQDAYKALQEANNWTTLSMDVEEVFDNGDVGQISEKLISMQKSLEMLSLSSSSSTQHFEKIQTLESLKDKFEKIVEPKLFDAFLNQSSETIEFYSKLFKELHRSNRLVTYYQSCLRDQILKEWHTQVKLDVDGTLLNWLNFLFDRLITIWKTQMNLCMKVLYPDDFQMSLMILCDIYTDILMSLDPTFESCIHNYLEQLSCKQNNSKTIRQRSLIELKQFTDGFIQSIEQNILSQYSGTENIEDFISNEKSIKSFLNTIYQPFAKMNEHYLLLEKDRLVVEFEDIKSNCDNVCSSEFVIKLFSMLRDSFKLFCQYVDTYPILILDEVIAGTLNQYLALIRDHINQSTSKHLHRIKKSNSDTSLQTLMISPNWSLIQQTLFTFQVIGEFLNQLNNFQQQIYLTFQEYHARHTPTAKADPSKSISYLVRFDLFILNLDTNPDIKNQIEKCLQSPPSVLLNNVLTKGVEIAKMGAEAICEAILDYVNVFLNNFILTIQQQMTHASSGDNIFDDSDSITFSPNEYITQIGQYLLTLPQHLETFNPNENNSFKTALKHSMEIFNQSGASGLQTLLTTDLSDNCTELLLLDSVLRKTVRTILDHILQLADTKVSYHKLNKCVKKQIGIDLAYLAAVCEDLGMTNDKELTLFIRVFNDINTLDSFRAVQRDYRIYHKMLTNLEAILSFD